MALSIFNTQQDVFFMQEALQLAKEAASCGEVPIGAVVVDQNGTIIGRGFNRVEYAGCQTAHAEVHAIQEATQTFGSWRLQDCWIYVTLEPCMMCIGLIRLSRIKGLIYAAKSPLFGYCGPEVVAMPMYKDISLIILSGLMEDEAKSLLQEFFKEKRVQR